jgi:hypothetical protein
MAKKTFYEILNSNEYSLASLQKLSFKMDATGPRCQVVFGKKYSDPRDSIENNDFTLKLMSIPADKEITEDKSKKSILARLIYNHKDF